MIRFIGMEIKRVIKSKGGGGSEIFTITVDAWMRRQECAVKFFRLRLIRFNREIR